MVFDKSGNNVLGVEHLHVCPNWFFCALASHFILFRLCASECVGRKRARPYGAMLCTPAPLSLKSCKWAAHNATQVHAPYDRHLLNAAREGPAAAAATAIYDARAMMPSSSAGWPRSCTHFVHVAGLWSQSPIYIYIYTTKQARTPLV
jgi:hypothetical protein